MKNVKNEVDFQRSTLTLEMQAVAEYAHLPTRV